MSVTSILVVANDVPRATREFSRRWGRTAGERVFFCDGTNDEVEINEALAMASEVGGVVSLSEGTFTTAAAIVFPADNLSLEGSGQSTVIDSTSVASAAITVTNHDRPSVRKIRLAGNFGTSVGIQLSNVSTPFIDGNVLDNYTTGISGDIQTSGGSVSNNDLTTCTTKLSLAGSGTVAKNNAGAGETIGKPTASLPEGTILLEAGSARLWVMAGGHWHTAALTLAWLDGWSYARPITVSNEGDAAVSSYHVKVTLDNTNMSFASAKSDGSDLRFTDGDGTTLLDHYVSAYDSGTQTATVWVKVPTLRAGSTTIHLYYGNAVATSNAKTFDQFFAKFSADADTLALWHCDDGSGLTAADAAGTYPLTLTNVTWGGTDGGGQDDTQNTFATGSYLVFNGTSSSATSGALLDTPPNFFTIKAWVKFTALTVNSAMWGKFQDALAPHQTKLIFQVLSTGAFSLDYNDNNKPWHNESAPLSWNLGQWYHVAMTVGNGGIRLYRNGVFVLASPFTVPLDAGTNKPLTFGSNPAKTSNWLNGAMDEIAVLSREETQAEIINSMQRSPRYTVATDQPSKLQREAAPVITGSQSWDENMMHESSVIRRDDGTWHAWYTAGGRTDLADQCIGYATSADGITWAKYANNPVFGQGEGEPGLVACSRVMWHATTSQYIMIYKITGETPGEGDGLRIATSADGITWTPYASNPVLVMVDDTWESVAGNASIWESGGTWYMLYEALDSVNGLLWRIGLATAPDYTGPWTKYAGNPLTTLSYGAQYGRPTAPYVDDSGLYHIWYHAGQFSVDGTTKTRGIVHAVSSDLHTWTKNDSTVLASSDAPNEIKGNTDPHILEYDDQVYLYYTQFANSVQTIGLARFDGTLEELITDITAPAGTVGSETTS